MSIVGKTWTEGTAGFPLPDACLISDEAWAKIKEFARAALMLAGLGTPKPFEIAYAVNPGKTDWVLYNEDTETIDQYDDTSDFDNIIFQKVSFWPQDMDDVKRARLDVALYFIEKYNGTSVEIHKLPSIFLVDLF